MGKSPIDIKNKVAYFYAVVKNMDLNDSIKESKIRNYEISLEENTYNYFSDLSDMDKQLSEANPLEWIELIENDDLRNVACNLKKDEKILLNYVFYEEKTQSEIAEIYGITQQGVSKNIGKLLSKIKEFLLNK